MRTEAASRGIRQEVVEEALANVEEPVPVVLERDRAQAETVLSIEAYLSRQITARRVGTGREMVARYATTLDEVSKAYGVPVPIISGIWGMESNFGRFSGVRPTVAALATLAWDPRRSSYFRGELFNALEILNRGDIDLARLQGILGRRDGTAAVHAVELSSVRAGLRRRWQARHLDDARRCVCLDCELPEGPRLDRRPDLGSRGQGLEGGGAARSREPSNAGREVARRLET